MWPLVGEQPSVLDHECDHQACGCDGCAEALPVPVENSERVWARVGEPMASPGWRGEERAWAGPPHLIADEKVRLALEDEESVDEVVMGMRVDALEFGREGHLEERQLRQLGLDQMR